MQGASTPSTPARRSISVSPPADPFLQSCSLALRGFFLAVVLVIALVVSVPAYASHFRFATLSWSTTGNAGEVEFRAKLGFRRSAEGDANVGDT